MFFRSSLQTFGSASNVNRPLRALNVIRLTCVAALAAACGDHGSTGPLLGPSTRFAPFVIRDTIQTVFSEPIVVTVRDPRGQPAENERVTISADLAPPAVDRFNDALALSPIKGVFGGFTNQISGATDSKGRFEVWARVGGTPGAIRLRVSSRFGSDSLDGVILPGRAHHFTISLRDTAVYAGTTLVPTIVARDIAENVASGAVVIAPRRPSVVDVVGSTIVARSTGRGYAIITADDARDSIGISVTPRGTLIATTFSNTGGMDSFVAFDLDGSNYRPITRSLPAANTRAPRWSEALNRIVYHDGGFPSTFGNGMFTMTETGTKAIMVPPLTVAATPAANEFASITSPSISSDGRFIYFAATTDYNETSLWSVRSDGTEAKRVGPPTTQGMNDSQPSVSPDGNYLAYTTNRFNLVTSGTRVMRLDLTTGATVPLAVLGTHPVWSPRGDEVAFFQNGLRVVRSDGTGETTLVSSVTFFDAMYGQIAWSPDGNWLAACATAATSGVRHIVLIKRADGDVLPLAFTVRENLCEAAWK